MTVFADAFFYVALVNRHDQFHGRVTEWARSFDGVIVTTQWALAEVADTFAQSHIRRRVKACFAELEQDTSTYIVKVTPEQFDRGLALYDSRPDKEWSLTDCISFIVMAGENLTDALTGDRHFEQAGFRRLFPAE